MNMLREFCNYFVSVMLGRRDSLTAFLEPLTMGERYLRWGLETKDIRDFRSAMDYLHLCYDRDAPMASLLIRKYSCIADVGAAAVESLLNRHQRVIDNSIKTENTYRDELGTINSKVDQLKLYIRKLQDEGSLIKAKTEESHVAELEANAERMREKLDSGEWRTEVFDSYDDITADAQRFFRDMDHASAVIMANTMLGSQQTGTMSSHLRTRLEHLRNRLEKANPIQTAPGTGGTSPPPPASRNGNRTAAPGRAAGTGSAKATG
ncbi:MAG: hypothetical protein LBE84_03735 [Planctomycetota bacterium]|jgi:hypothetical protein|nr:hypothetical protein [Planctomycetota bacterium]